VPTKDALARAKEAELDLVEVAPQSDPPVCRIMDYGKWKYAQRKRDHKAKRHEPELKHIRIRTPKIGEHDLMIKVSHAREFLQRGDRVQFILRFRGRELAHIDEGQKVFQRIRQDLADVSRAELEFRREGRRITMLLVPGPRHPANNNTTKSAPEQASQSPGIRKPGD